MKKLAKKEAKSAKGKKLAAESKKAGKELKRLAGFSKTLAECAGDWPNEPDLLWPENKNIVIAQSGGPTAVINSSLLGLIDALMDIPHHGKILGAKHGIEGILKSDYIDLGGLDDDTLEALTITPSAALGSSRRKPDAEDCHKIFEEFKRQGVGFFFYIGGNDSADTARIIAEEAEEDGYSLTTYHVPKTIDNDLRSCHVTPGYGSAATFVANALRGDDLDNKSLGGVKIDIIMGRDAGFLTAASALARQKEGDGPHLIYLPEVPFSLEKFVSDVNEAVKKHGRCVVAVSEGIRDAEGERIGAKLGSGEKDPHGNVQMSGTGALGDYLAQAVRASGIKRVRADTFGYLQRSYPGSLSYFDVMLAMTTGTVAAYSAVASQFSKDRIPKAGTVAIRLKDTVNEDDDLPMIFEPVPIANAARDTRSMPPNFIAPSGTDVTEEFIAYAELAAELPEDMASLF